MKAGAVLTGQKTLGAFWGNAACPGLSDPEAPGPYYLALDQALAPPDVPTQPHPELRDLPGYPKAFSS